jgi:hypothetical protein
MDELWYISTREWYKSLEMQRSKTEEIKTETIFYSSRFWTFIFLTTGKIAAEKQSTSRGLRTPALE